MGGKFELLISAIVVILVTRSIALSGLKDKKQGIIGNTINDLRDSYQKVKESLKNAKNRV